ncbi:MAG: leucyl aminopeptidase [Ignavibacteriaceae bacterium]|jgi:leucyl aminopeptidase|nr:leucyl aminopeptidase [Ignavibacteriaceae bacterium]
MYKINLISGGTKISYQPLSITLKYLIDDKKTVNNLLNLENIFNFKFSELQKKNFLSSEINRIRINKPSGKPDAVIFQKIKTDDLNADYFRDQLAEFIANQQSEVIKNLYVFIPSFSEVKKYFDNEEYYYQSFAEGILLGNYSFNKYKKEKQKDKNLNVYFYAEDQKKLKSALTTAQNLISSVALTRDYQNEPANNLTPDLFAKRIINELRPLGIKVTVFGQKEIRKRKMGGLIAIGQGSVNKPRFIVLEYKPQMKFKNEKTKTIALVGKGITFDTGGISLKPSKGMGAMKADMSGAAVVAGTLSAAAKSNLPVHLYGIIPAAENMCSGESIRPGDIVKISNGKSVEIEDTDAEGRVVLADALHYASQLKPDQIIDLATLTGACVVALGEFVAGLFTKDEQMAEQLYKSGIKTYDRVWRLPLWDDFDELIKSDIADVANLGNTRWAGAITAAKFLEHFVDKNIPWTHLDIAGPAMNNSSKSYTKKYMTGFGVRLLFDYLSNRI